MAEINAFVAYSFSMSDKELIGKFVDHFNSLASSLPGFRWEDAQQAEPASVSGKVLTKIDGKNLFIGICTRKEYAVPLNAPTRFRFLNFITLSATNIQCKTSDWIIQEIGLAVGRGIKVIIFIEDGVRKPGELFGDIEYIPFSRSNPHTSFDKLLQMLGTLIPRGINITSVSDPKSVMPEKPKEFEDSQLDLEPKPSWDQSTYDRAAARAIAFMPSAFAQIDASYRSSPLAKGINLTIWEARIEFFRMIERQKADFEKIKNAAHNNPTNSKLISFVAFGYQLFGDHQASARAFEDAAANTETDDPERVQYLANAASQYARDGQLSRSNEILEVLKRDLGGKPDLEYKLLYRLRSLADADKNSELALVIMEQMVMLRPDDTIIRFDLAYKHSQTSNHDMALYHYLKIPEFERDAATWNNLGATYNEFAMPINSIASFRKAADESETLAISNLGFRFLEAGFLPEAEREVEKALSIKPHHKNVPLLLQRLHEIADDEQDKLTNILEKTKMKAAFYRKLGKGVLKATPQKVALNWNSPEGALEAKLDGTEIRFFGTYERSLGSLAALLSYSSRGPIDQLKSIHRTEFAGQIHGNVIIGHLKRSTEGERQSLFGSSGDGVETVMVFNDDNTELFVMEHFHGVGPRFYTLTCS